MFVQLVKKTSVLESEENEGEEKEEEMFDSSFLAEMYEVIVFSFFSIRFDLDDVLFTEKRTDLQDVKCIISKQTFSEIYFLLNCILVHI